ncbi:Hypothetical protein A7982_03207 [Minicystis rosea]|nr:Hypothetical protein A7982_03207 [Minicystis rosea]
MSFIPVTAQDFIKIGERFDSADIVAEIDRLLPLATADIVLLATRGYGQSLLDELKEHRSGLIVAVAERDRGRGTKKGARRVEGDAVDAGKLVLRSGVTLVMSAITHRKPAAGEMPEQTKQVATDLAAKIEGLGGRIGNDSAKLRTRLTTLAALLAEPVLAPAPAEAQARADFLAKVTEALAELPSLAEQKKGTQQDAKQETSSVNELDGRAYTNVKTLVQVGRAYWNEHANRKRAAEYNLSGLLETTTKRKSTAPKKDGAPA